jgi:uncharacterized membrane protein (GlpM family)
MKKRGKVLRDTNAGPGLLSVEGQQYPFNLEGLWKSDTAPKPNMVVDVEFGEGNSIRSVQPIAESQLAKEQAEVALLAAKEKGMQFASGLTAKFGVATIVAMALLVVGWFFLNTVSVKMIGVKAGMTFWQILSVVNSPMAGMAALGGGSSNTGIYGLLAVLALLGPLVRYFWKDRRAYLAGLLPLFFMVFVGIMIYVGIMDIGAQSGLGGKEAAKMAADIAKSTLDAIGIGLGGYLSVAVSLYFAGTSGMKFLAYRG